MLAFRCYPLQSFSNAEQLSAKLRPQPTGKSECCKFQFPRSRLGLVRGWTVYERGDRPGHFAGALRISAKT